MSSAATVPMIDAQGNPGLVDASKVDAAKANGFTPAVKMVSPQGQIGYIAQGKVDSARQSNYSVHPDSGQLMITPEGQRTYALPEEVDKFKASGHTLIHPDGQFRVNPLPGEDNLQTEERARNVIKALSPEEQAKAIKAEKDWWTSKEGLKEEAKGLADVGLVAASTLPIPVGAAGKAVEAGGVGLKALGAAEAMQLFKSSPRLYTEYLLKTYGPTVAKEGGKYLLKAGATGAGTMLGLKWLGKL